MKKLSQNKGVALVTVLVVTTFMTLVATTLLYMSYMNYMTKSMRHMSTDNFYTDEFALDDLATELQQFAANKPKETAVTDLIAAVKDGDNNHWSTTKMRSFINLATAEADIVVEAVDGKNDIKYSTNYVTFKNVRIKSKTKKGGYESSIVTDLSIAWPSVPKESYGVYDFSLITDSQIDLISGDMAVGGCLYCKQPEGKDSAIKVECGGTLALNGPVSVVHGDIIVEKGGVMAISGKLYVTGTIKIDEGGTVYVVSDTVVYGGDEPEMSRIKGNSTKVVKKDNATAWVAEFDALAEEGNGIAGDMVNEHLKVKLNGLNYVDIFDKPWKENPAKGYLCYNTQFYKKSKKLKDGTQVGAYVGLPTDTSNGLNDTLVISNQAMTIRGDCSNSTFISTAKDKITLDISGVPTFMQHMTEEGYEAAKNILYRPGMDYMNSSNVKAAYATSYKTFGGTADNDDYFDNVKDNAVVFATDTFGTEKIEYYYLKDTDKNIIPVGNLITPKAESNVSKILSIATGGGVKPDSSEIYYSNWYKE
ncbi:MAG: hypothetical protein K5686_05565 [Lachnospiraceae bacterium]|nr:hypothetical protein [Lachnospiraceae bacterium]